MYRKLNVLSYGGRTLQSDVHWMNPPGEFEKCCSKQQNKIEFRVFLIFISLCRKLWTFVIFSLFFVLGLDMDGSTTATTSDRTVDRHQQCRWWAQVYYVAHVWRWRTAAANWRRTVISGTRNHVRGPSSGSQHSRLVRMVVGSRVLRYV